MGYSTGAGAPTDDDWMRAPLQASIARLQLQTPRRDSTMHLAMMTLELMTLPILKAALWKSNPQALRQQWVDCRPTRMTADRHPILVTLALRDYPEVTGRFRCKAAIGSDLATVSAGSTRGAHGSECGWTNAPSAAAHSRAVSDRLSVPSRSPSGFAVPMPVPACTAPHRQCAFQQTAGP